MADQDVLAQFERDGYLGPVRCVDAATVGRFADEFSRAVLPQRRNTHLQFGAAAAICRSNELLDLCGQLLGPNIAIWRSAVFAGTPDLALHRDVYADNIAGVNLLSGQLSVHVAVTSSHEENCLVVIPGSHRMSAEDLCRRTGLAPARAHIPGNTRFKGRAGALERKITLQPGEAVFLHPLCVHGSSVVPSSLREVSDGPDRSNPAVGSRRAGGAQPAANLSSARVMAAPADNTASTDRVAFVLRLVSPELTVHEAGPRPLAKLLRRRARCTMLSGDSGRSKNRFLPLAPAGPER